MNDYARLNTLPAALSVAFVLSSLYQFGGISSVELTWLGYSLTGSHAMLISIVVYLLAFASSETKQFDNYSDREMVAIAAGPALIFGYYAFPLVRDLVHGIGGGSTGPILAFLVTLLSWGVAVK